MRGWLIALGVVLLITILPLGCSLWYDAEGLRIFILAGPFRICVYPVRKRVSKKSGKPETKLPKRTSEKKPVKDTAGGSLRDFRPLLKLALSLLNELRCRLLVRRLELSLLLAGDDPYDLAILQGRIWAAIGCLDPILNRSLRIRRKHVDISSDFLRDTSVITARMDVTITVGHLMVLGVRFGARAIRLMNEIKNQKKVRQRE